MEREGGRERDGGRVYQCDANSGDIGKSPHFL